MGRGEPLTKGGNPIPRPPRERGGGPPPAPEARSNARYCECRPAHEVCNPHPEPAKDAWVASGSVDWACCPSRKFLDSATIGVLPRWARGIACGVAVFGTLSSLPLASRSPR